MKTRTLALGAIFPAAVFSLTARAINGDNMIGVGPISRSMGGVGLAKP